MYYVSSIRVIPSNTIELDKYFFEITDSKSSETAIYKGNEVREMAREGKKIIGYKYNVSRNEIISCFCASKSYIELLNNILKVQIKCKLANSFVDLKYDFKGANFIDITNLINQYCTRDNSIYVPVLNGSIDLDSKILYGDFGEVKNNHLIDSYFKTENGYFSMSIEELDNKVLDYKPTGKYLYNDYWGIVYLLKSVRNRNKFRFGIIDFSELEKIENMNSLWSIQKRQGLIKEVIG